MCNKELCEQNSVDIEIIRAVLDERLYKDYLKLKETRPELTFPTGGYEGSYSDIIGFGIGRREGHSVSYISFLNFPQKWGELAGDHVALGYGHSIIEISPDSRVVFEKVDDEGYLATESPEESGFALFLKDGCTFDLEGAYELVTRGFSDGEV